MGDVLELPGSTFRRRFADQGVAKTSPYSMGVWHSTHFDCSASSIVQPLPASPAVGDEVELYLDAVSGTNTLTGTFNGSTVMTLKVAGHKMPMRYNGTTWVKTEEKTLASEDGRYGFYTNVKSYGAKGDGSTDDTTAIDAAWAAAVANGSYTLMFPPGNYHYNGSGITPASGKSVRILGAGSAATTITLGSGDYFIVLANASLSVVLEQLTISGGAGAVHGTYTSNSVDYINSFVDVRFLNYTVAAVSHNALDMPYWHFERCIFAAANDVSTIGVALCGDSSSSSFINCEFQKNNIHVKFKATGSSQSAGPATHFFGCEFIRFSAYSGTPRIAIWVVPDSTGLSNAGGSGFTCTSCKFGVENLNAADYHVLYANEASPSGDNATSYPVYTQSTGWVENHIFRDCYYSAGAPFIVSTTTQLVDFRIEDLVVWTTSTWPDYLVKFLFTDDQGRNRNSTIRLAARDYGGNLLSFPLDPSVSAICNMPGWAYIEDPTVRTPYSTEPHTRTGGNDTTDYVNLLSVKMSSWSTHNGSTSTPVTDAAGGSDATEINFTASNSSLLFNLTTTASIQIGQPIWVEFDVKSGASGSISTLNTVVGSYARQVQVTSTWRRFRFLTYARTQSYSQFLLVQGNGVTGTVQVGRVRVYQAREPLNVLGYVPDMMIASGGVVTKTKAGVPTDSDLTNPKDGALIVDTTDNALYFRSGSSYYPATVAKANYTATTDPTTTSDSAAGYAPGSRWVNTTSKVLYECVDATATAAVWRRLTADIQIFGSSGTWTKPAWTQVSDVVAIGPGGSGAAGARGAAGTARAGGGGGGAGSLAFRRLAATSLGSTETVTVGTGGAAVSGQSSDTTAGANGNSGSGTTTFGNHVKGNQGGGGTGGGIAAGGNAGAGGGGGGGTGGAGSTSGAVGGASTANATGASGGGAGGGITTGDAVSNGGQSQATAVTGLSAAGGGNSGGTLTGGTGASGATNEAIAGTGGGGGASSITTTSGTGGDGGKYGAGGGGGGASVNGQTSGGGGKGADGIVIVISQ